MKCNVGETDRKIRIAVGVVALYLSLTVSPWFLMIATGTLLSAIVKLCPLYTLLGTNTCSAKKNEKQSVNTDDDDTDIDK